MFRVKICGIASPDDARVAAEAGADAIGLNFYAKSPRAVTRELAAQIVRGAPRSLVKVGVFVNTPAADVARVYDELGLDLIQLHGDETPAFMVELEGRPIMRAFRIGPDGFAPVREYLTACRQLGSLPRLLLVDAFRAGAYGGTGETADWQAIADFSDAEGSKLPPAVLAGGLRPENVAEAIRTARPAAVDTASGVERSPGRKDPALVHAFVAAARRAFEQMRV